MLCEFPTYSIASHKTCEYIVNEGKILCVVQNLKQI